MNKKTRGDKESLFICWFLFVLSQIMGHVFFLYAQWSLLFKVLAGLLAGYILYVLVLLRIGGDSRNFGRILLASIRVLKTGRG